ncbi:MAG: TPM domain-containing protein [Candidatus Bipolaricaulota bacterium]|nr:TPM domain-containing protein [Candidatus Bipolaricaulota bacterium]MDW8031805.1 TPM domain-containing protein [Candidatus Bipolaricaulota bacterium]
MIHTIWVFVYVILLSALVQEIPAFQGYVSDYAGVLSAQRREQLTALLDELEQKTTARIAVVTVKTTHPYDDLQYAKKLLDAWRISQKGDPDNSALFLVVTEDQGARIVTGYGLEGILPSWRVSAILDEFVLPEFRAGRFDEGIYKGTWAVALVISQEARVELTGDAPIDVRRLPGTPSPGGVILALIVILALVSLMMRRARRDFGAGLRDTRSARRRSLSRFGGGFSRGSFGGFGGGH